MISLALFLSSFIMAPTLTEAWRNGIEPLLENRIDETEAFDAVSTPFRKFMLAHVRDKDLELFEGIAKVPAAQTGAEAPLQVLVPAFMISELRRAFEIGFLLYLPFVVIDMIIASILMAMGMMMVPPVTISLPFKLIFFVLIDGWYMVAGSLVKSFNAV
jgi:flagellar biosynthetic protein FliP